jgi:UDP-N-acetylmuramyl pentapeptide phosphotransferase/UDP-N-acetylglucosamine-1-phosphate transferase
MARGDHPRRTPVYGGLLIAAAMIGATLVVVEGAGLPTLLRAVLLVLAGVAALGGWLLTFRDLTPRRRSGR